MGRALLTWGGEEGQKAACEFRKIFLFFLSFYLETTLVLTMLNTGCVVSLCCCRSVNSVSGKSPHSVLSVQPRHFQCQALLGLTPTRGGTGSSRSARPCHPPRGQKATSPSALGWQGQGCSPGRYCQLECRPLRLGQGQVGTWDPWSLQEGRFCIPRFSFISLHPLK